MDYDTDSEAVLRRAQRYLDYADSMGKNGSVRVGLWLAGWNESGAAYNSGDMSRNESDIEAQMARLRPRLANAHTSFQGFAVFTDSGGPGSPTPSDLEPWRDQSEHQPSPGPFSPAAQVGLCVCMCHLEKTRPRVHRRTAHGYSHSSLLFVCSRHGCAVCKPINSAYY
eukprot:SAG25_NODE_1810_length_2297_cov_2.274216_1_plen_168_part_00